MVSPAGLTKLVRLESGHERRLVGRREAEKRSGDRRMQAARLAFIRACGVPSASYFRPLRGAATVTEVGYFDYYHGQTSVAPNAIELHPVGEMGGC